MEIYQNRGKVAIMKTIFNCFGNSVIELSHYIITIFSISYLREIDYTKGYTVLIIEEKRKFKAELW